MIFFRVLYKTLITSLVIISFFIVSALIQIALPFSRFRKRKVITKVSVFHAKIMLKTLGFKLSLKGSLPKEGVMIIGNHMSYLDILIYLSFFEALFVTSVDMRERLFLGQITQMGGCLFVERRNPRKLPQEMRSIKEFFTKGFSVCIFPEGTSSDGSSVLPFKNSMFQIPLETGCPVQPIALKYTDVDGQAFGPKTCDLVCWYGELKFFPHLVSLFKLKTVEANLYVLPTIDASKFSNRKELSHHAHGVLSKAYSSNID